jgi:hypothetical protein
MNPEVKTIWIGALSGGQYVQAREAFQQEDLIVDEVRHCCLAVLTDQAVEHGVTGVRRSGPWLEEALIYDEGEYRPPTEEELDNLDSFKVLPHRLGDDREVSTHVVWAQPDEGELPDVVVRWAGLDGANPPIGEHRAITRNDDLGQSYGEIADAIQEHL